MRADRETARRARRERIKERGHDQVIADGKALGGLELAERCTRCFGEGRRVEQGKGWVACDVCGGSGRKPAAGEPDVIDRALDAARGTAADQRNGTAASSGDAASGAS